MIFVFVFHCFFRKDETGKKFSKRILEHSFSHAHVLQLPTTQHIKQEKSTTPLN